MSGDNVKTPAAAQPAAGVAPGWQRLSPSLVIYRGRRDDMSQAWLLTFTDLAALMLTFFVLLFSMSTIKDSDWQNLVDSLSPQLDRVQEVTLSLPQFEKTAEEAQREPGSDLDYLTAVLKEHMAANPDLAAISVEHDGNRVVIAVPGDLLFAPGSTTLGEAGGKAAFTLSSVLRSLRNVIEIAGHADPNPPKGGPYPSNWELSLARAVVLAEMLKGVGYRGDIIARGYGDARFGALDPALKGDARLARARRVDIIVHAYASEAR